jgi:hypothetical protein
MTQLLFDIYAAQNVSASVVNANTKIVGRVAFVSGLSSGLYCCAY